MKKFALFISLFIILLLLFFVGWMIGRMNVREIPFTENTVDKTATTDSEIALVGKIADKIVVDKSDRRLSLLSQGKVLKSYSVALGWQPEGKKQREGDGRTPEGIYKIDYRNPNSAYHLSLHVSYPNEADVKNAQAGGYSAGNNIMIHGIKNGFGQIGKAHRSTDWTAGCIAVTDGEIEEIWHAVPDGTVIEIKP